LWAHVLFGKFFLGFLLVAVALAMVQLANQAVSDADTLKQRERLLWQLLAWSFVFHSGMLIAGSAWAHEAWGRFWAWDPLEVWSLLTWFLLGLLLHFRVTFKIPPVIGWIWVVAVFVIAFLTFFGVPFFSVAPHQGAF
jgi:ABC-type transport system involved in cytochrome c biogenesis permease subunit